ncbi:MAG: oligosaccharide flippase family protein [Candidatus Riflebacteria bacterium]|nr:oligosaccharide flippase family protein [Candidatus Riflebacteria bacterium]
MNYKKIAQFSLGPLLSAALSMATLPAIAWFFTKEDIGRIAMLQVACSFAALLFSLGLDQAYVREYHETERKGSLLLLTILPGFLMLILAVPFSYLYRDKLMLIIYDQTSMNLYLLTLVTIFAGFVSRYFSLVLRMQERAMAYSLSQVLPKVIFALVVFSYWLFSVTKDFEKLALAQMLSILSVLMVLIWIIRNDLLAVIKEKIDWGKLRGLLIFGAPLILGGVAFWGLSAMSRLMLRSSATYSELGLYSVGQSFAGAGLIFQSIFSTVWAPMVYKWSAKGENLEKIDSITEYMLAMVVFTFVICGMTSWLVPLFLPKDYGNVQYIMVACLGQPLLYTLSETTVVGVGLARKSLYAMLAPIFALIANFFLCWIWVPDYGARGAAMATFVAFFVFFLVRTESSAYVWRSFPRKKIYFCLIILLFATGLTTLGGEERFLLSILIWLAIFIIATYSFWEIVFKVLLKLRLSVKKLLQV